MDRRLLICEYCKTQHSSVIDAMECCAYFSSNNHHVFVPLNRTGQRHEEQFRLEMQQRRLYQFKNRPQSQQLAPKRLLAPREASYPSKNGLTILNNSLNHLGIVNLLSKRVVLQNPPPPTIARNPFILPGGKLLKRTLNSPSLNSSEESTSGLCQGSTDNSCDTSGTKVLKPTKSIRNH